MSDAPLVGILFLLLVVLPWLGALVTAVTPLVARVVGRWQSEEEQVAPAPAVVASVACGTETVIAAGLLLCGRTAAESALGPITLRCDTNILRAVCASALAALAGSAWTAVRVARARTALSVALMLWCGWSVLTAAGASLWPKTAALVGVVGLAVAATLLVSAMTRASTAPPSRTRWLEASGMALVFLMAVLCVWWAAAQAS